jgi:hypothetical protein
MGKKAKEHRKKVAKRNEQIKLQRKSQEKIAIDFLRKMIEKEKEGGAFNSPVQPLPNSSGSVPTFEGPQL